jgi:hypothetical protein
MARKFSSFGSPATLAATDCWGPLEPSGTNSQQTILSAAASLL